MSAEPPQISILDARLAEIDKRLRTIQTGLVTEPAASAVGAHTASSPPPPAPAAPAPTAPAPSDTAPELPPRVEVPEPGASAAGLRAVPARTDDQSLLADAQSLLADAVAQLRELAVAHEHLLGSTRDLLSEYERAVTEARSTPAAAARTSSAEGAGAGEEVRSLTVTGGPFASTESVRGFERALAALPGVSGVELRGYEGGNRAILDVHLSATTS
jgi:hypothetical protein